jgi:hypothetical protein
VANAIRARSLARNVTFSGGGRKLAKFIVLLLTHNLTMRHAVPTSAASHL